MRNKARVAKLATILMMGLMFSVFLLDILTVLLFNHYEKRYPVAAADTAFIGTDGSRIHFLNTGNSDAILLESDGHFALVDSGWGSENPNLKARRQGYERSVIEYLKKVALRNGTVTLDFVLLTHYHYDHAGGFPAIFSDPAIRVGQAFFRSLEAQEYAYEHSSWQMEEIFNLVNDAAAAAGVPVRRQLPAEPFQFGAMRLQLFNTDSYDDAKLKGENDNSVVTLVTVNGSRVLLTGDTTAMHGLEKKLAEAVGQIDLLKLCHHGYAMSNSIPFLRGVKPKLAIVTNGLGQVYPNVKWNLVMNARCPYYSTVRENGIIAAFGENGRITLSGNLM
ncbi:MAG: MBL fold metallo-hydrolase [Oscillospiraceae bacterium]|jgi:beta-lactamase superfamily II metal-dependent hydrolase|nr:MBL fold metallo-hydrolase [Oscillospiraceae bacterium]